MKMDLFGISIWDWMVLMIFVVFVIIGVSIYLNITCDEDLQSYEDEKNGNGS